MKTRKLDFDLARRYKSIDSRPYAYQRMCTYLNWGGNTLNISNAELFSLLFFSYVYVVHIDSGENEYTRPYVLQFNKQWKIGLISGYTEDGAYISGF